MLITKDYDFSDLFDACWSGAEITLQKIQDAGKEDDFITLLENLFHTPTITEVNDWLRFDSDFIFNELGIEADE